MAVTADSIAQLATVEKSRGYWRSVGARFLRDKVAVCAGLMAAGLILMAIFAPWVAPHDPYDLTNISLMDSFLPPAWMEGGDARFLLGTDDQGRGILGTAKRDMHDGSPLKTVIIVARGEKRNRTSAKATRASSEYALDPWPVHLR